MKICHWSILWIISGNPWEPRRKENDWRKLRKIIFTGLSLLCFSFIQSEWLAEGPRDRQCHPLRVYLRLPGCGGFPQPLPHCQVNWWPVHMRTEIPPKTFLWQPRTTCQEARVLRGPNFHFLQYLLLWRAVTWLRQDQTDPVRSLPGQLFRYSLAILGWIILLSSH